MFRDRCLHLSRTVQDAKRLTIIRSVRGSNKSLSGFYPVCMTVGLLCVALFCRSSEAQTRSYSYNPNHLDAIRVIEAMKTPHSDLTLMSAHRGLHAIPGDNPNVPGVPENSLASIAAAARAGLEVLELDVKQTSDGQLTFSHDKTWGRQAVFTSGGPGSIFNPFTDPAGQTAFNPLITSMTMAQTQANLLLRDSVSLLYPSNPEPPPTLQNVINFYNANQIQTVLAFDIKDAATFHLVWNAINGNSKTNQQQQMDFLGRPFRQDVVFKISGNLYPTPQAFHNDFGADAPYLNMWWIYNTSDIDPSSPFGGGEQAITNSLNSFYQDTTLSTISAEITQKQSGGILDTMRTTNIAQGRSVAEFSPTGDYFDPNDPTHTARFFSSQNGSCFITYDGVQQTCQTLNMFHYSYPGGTPADTADTRSDLNFVVGKNFNIITADSAAGWAAQLAGLGLRNLSYMQENGYSDGNNCSGVNGAVYPGCNADGTTLYTHCIAENQTCNFAGTRVVAFGANGKYNYLTVTNTTACSVSAFGDPTPGLTKACYYSPALGLRGNHSQPGVYCADEGGTCTFNGVAIGALGLSGSFASIAGFQNSFACSVSTFYTDPAPNHAKTCYYQLSSGNLYGGPAGYVLCAQENQTCSYAGPGRIAFGANGHFNYQTLSGGTPCSASVFGDPNQGVVKACYYQFDIPIPQSASSGSTGSSSAPDFGPNVIVLDPTMSAASINATLNSLNQETQFSTNRHAVLLKPGNYGTASSPVVAQLGFYEQISGLGQSPTNVSVTGGFGADQLISGNMTQNFWRSQENMAVSPAGGLTANVLDWGVSQGASLRRMLVSGGLWLANSGTIGSAYPCQEASGGFIADSQLGSGGNGVNACSQQQWYTRNTYLVGGFNNYVWNFVFSGDTGIVPAQSYPGGPAGAVNVTNVATTPVSREKPFLYLDINNLYNVFVPTVRTNSTGTSWAGDVLGTGHSLPITSFYIAQPSSTIDEINSALASGQNLILTPGIYQYTDSIRVENADTVVLGMGFPTIVPQAGTPAITVADVDGVQVAGVMIDAGPVNSSVLVEVGVAGSVNNTHAANPTSLNDVFFRIGGSTAGSATTSLQVDSGSVILDNIWAWRADHGNPGTVGWTVNTAAHGVVVNGNGVTALGLAVEHYQQEQVLWFGDNGQTIFYQSELPYDPPNQAAWSSSSSAYPSANGSVNGYPSYVVSPLSVCNHKAYGLGIYSYFNQSVKIVEDNAMIVPTYAGIQIADVGTVFLNGSGQISNIINGTGGPASSANAAVLVPKPSYVGSGVCEAQPH
ncbi:glycerophosphodiester phosphodiesterase family protein [Granulicella arctica]|uniref:glycerophosphodiester phosphodiesterase family protein n=1 Tax=Granulicella arctica TaxID=940613 RepID=UPI0021E0AAB9|nr:glycerophosphodiester phosphodiesterase family protein [Granulicella arctica]